MKALQVGIASVLVVFLVASLPGLYRYTEYSPRFRSIPETAGRHPPSPRKPDDSGNETERLAETPFTLSPLSGEARKRAARRLKIDVNKASVSRLETLPGIGPTTARDIVEHRRENGEFSSLSELDRVPNIGPATLNKITKRILIEGRSPGSSAQNEPRSSAAAPLDINTAGKPRLKQVDGIGDVTADRIVRFRRNNGPIDSPEELKEIDGIGPVTVDRLKAATEGPAGGDPE